jgi:carbon-monoxide dehydrogenase medium subunit
MYETELQRHELLTALLVPPPVPNCKETYLKFTTRSSEDRPCAGVAARVQCSNGVCEEARVVVGAVSPTPVVVTEQNSVRGKKLNRDLIEEIALEAENVVDPIDDLRGSAEYKRHLVKVLVRRALSACVPEELV